MFQSIVNLYDIFRTDLDYAEFKDNKNEKFSTNPADYLSDSGFYQ